MNILLVDSSNLLIVLDHVTQEQTFKPLKAAAVSKRLTLVKSFVMVTRLWIENSLGKD